VPLLAGGRGSTTVLLRPEDLRLAAGGDALVELTEYFGHDTVYLVRTADDTEVRVRAGAAPVHRRGDRVTVRYEGPPAISYATDAAMATSDEAALTSAP